MTVSAERASFGGDSMWVSLSDGRVLGVTIAWFPRFCHAPQDALERCEFSADGIHWEALDEDISVAGLLAGRGDRTWRERTIAAA